MSHIHVFCSQLPTFHTSEYLNKPRYQRFRHSAYIQVSKLPRFLVSAVSHLNLASYCHSFAITKLPNTRASKLNLSKARNVKLNVFEAIETPRCQKQVKR